jgi:hypothetical protein
MMSVNGAAANRRAPCRLRGVALDDPVIANPLYLAESIDHARLSDQPFAGQPGILKLLRGQTAARHADIHQYCSGRLPIPSAPASTTTPKCFCAR